jgi:glycosyltransferase involved in cell wall biosynthesis
VGVVRGPPARPGGQRLSPGTLHLLVPGDLATPTGGYRYERRIVAGLQAIGWHVTAHRLGDGFPWPSAAELEGARHLLASLPDGATAVIDGLAMGGLGAPLAAERERLTLVGLVHHPVCLETGLAPPVAAALHGAETQALSALARVVVTSAYTGRLMARFGVGEDRIGVVPPGTDPAPLAAGSRTGPVALLCVATLTPRKGHATLLQALARLPHPGWHLTCAGSASRSPETARAVHAASRALGLEERVTWLGEVDDRTLEQAYRAADVFVLPSHFEGYGMVLGEALAHGLPLVTTRAGAIPETVPEGAGLLVPAGDPQALAGALLRMVAEAPLRARLAAAARAARARLPTWDDAVVRFAAEIGRAAPG